MYVKQAFYCFTSILWFMLQVYSICAPTECTSAEEWLAHVEPGQMCRGCKGSQMPFKCRAFAVKMNKFWNFAQIISNENKSFLGQLYKERSKTKGHYITENTEQQRLEVKVPNI